MMNFWKKIKEFDIPNSAKMIVETLYEIVGNKS